MNSPKANSKFKNLNVRPRQSPQEIKERMRKNYKSKIQTCRDILLDKFRGDSCGKSFNNITEFYKNMFNYPLESSTEEESEILEELKNELLQEEMQWWLSEYEKSEMDGIDWSSIEQDHVICPMCQKEDLKLIDKNLSCSCCKNTIKTQKSLADIQILILNNIEHHNLACSLEPQFLLIPDPSGSHMYLMCECCNEMKLII